MSRQQQYHDDDQEAQYAAGEHQPQEGAYYDQEYDQRQDYDPRQSARSDGYYQDYEEGRFSQQGGYYEGSDVGEGGAYPQQREGYASQESRADYYRQDAYADEYPDAYPAGVDPYGAGPPLDSRKPSAHVPGGQQQYYQDQRGADRKGKRNGSSEDDSESFSDFTMRSDMARAAEMDMYRDERYYGRSTDSLSQMGDRRGYGRPPSSQVSYGGNRSSGASTPIYNMDFQGFGANSREPYPAWTTDNQIPLSKEEIEAIFMELQAKFGFQMDSVRNMFDHMMTLLDSRASRMTPNQALLSLHADFIGGDTANYKKWYFAAQVDVDDAVGFANVKLGKTNRRTRKARAAAKKARGGAGDDQTLEQLEGDYSLEAGEYRWKTKMNQMSQHDRARQLALYLCCWGESNQVRFVPECLCFIFKCCDDYLRSPECQSRYEPLEEGFYLNTVITPIYRYMRDQGYEIFDGKYVRRERDHNKVIGYDDINQLFWYPQGIERIVLDDKTRLIDVPPSQRFFKFGQVEWKKVFFKTYKETRSWFHLMTNFNRIWIIHITMFWYYTSYNAPTLLMKDYKQTETPDAPAASQWTVCGLGGAVATLLMIIATLAEWAYVPREFAGAQPLGRRFCILLVLFALNVVPAVYILAFNNQGDIALTIGIVHFFFSLVTFIFFAIMPLGKLSGNLFNRNPRRFLANKVFTSNYHRLRGNDMFMSIGLWVLVFSAKFSESYIFLTRSFKDPIRILSIMEVTHCSDKILSNYLCQYQPRILLGLMFCTDLVLFFLDTYLWYIIWNTVFSVARSFYLGISIWTPWRNVFARLPKRIYSKVLATGDMEIKYKPKVLISQIWNAIVISMYREHLLSIDHVQKLLYHQVPSEQEGKRTLRAPTFFVAQEDHSFNTEFFPAGSEAERRISFFAQSLSTPIPEPAPVDNMPTFTVLVPHYSEKILLSLREIIREEHQLSRVTLLEYLKQLHPVEWDCFVKDTKVLAEETASFNGTAFDKDEKDTVKAKIDDLPFYCIGFKSAAPEYTLRTRIWASLRSQTLYRTVSGFMNYPRAIKLLYRVENPEVVQMFGGNTDKLDRELERMARRKFKFVISMQRYTKFTTEEKENTEFILRAYPDLQIAYLDEEPPLREGDEPRLFSALIDGHCEIMENGSRRPKFRVQLSGNPILGDGKSDNQNHAIIFYRGEYIQLIDANQDNYLEECLKIRSVLAEFEEMTVDNLSPYTPGYTPPTVSPVAILGAREYIFSENIGILGDVAAGKEQTFGTLFARTLAQIGGKLHYGHPDFLNGIYMTTRGGVSKAQKGLHLNEDIYAGMVALLRGGRIKHCEYYQCGKGRDMGFGSILNFVTKIGTGMGEQMLSREYYYMGTQLPLDRFLSFYYAHPGFHVNNLFIILSVQLFMLVLLNLGALRHETISCDLVTGAPFTDPQKPDGCYNTDPIMAWVSRCVLSIFIVFFVAFVPLIVQELTERGFWRAAKRFAKHIISLSPLFEVFVCQIYANSLLTNLSLGGARYIATGRGFATARIPFSILYSRFAGPCIYLGARSIMMLLFGTMTTWIAALIYFWISLLALMLSPFIFNPHQFAWQDFFVDYREFIRWMSRGNSLVHANSWIGYCRLSRTRITGYKRKQLGVPSDKTGGDIPRAHFTNIFFSEVVGPFLLVIFTLVPYTFINAQSGFIYIPASDGPFPNATPTNSLIRIAIIAFAPIAVNAGLLLGLFGMACCMGPCLMMCCKKFGSVLAAIGHAVAVLMLIIMFEVLWFLERWSLSKALLGMITVIAIQRFIFKALTCVFLTREFRHDETNRAWWTGKWVGSGLGYHTLSQPAREYLCKIIELSLFAADFILAHIILFFQLPVLLIPYVDRWHSVMLFWLRPSRQIRPPIFSMKQNRLRKRIVRRYATLYFILFIVFIALVVGPLVAGNSVPTNIGGSLLTSWGLIQPNNGNPNQTMPDNLNATFNSSS